MKKTANIVLGSYVNGYSIIQELHENGVKDIIVIDIDKDVSAYSNKIKRFIQIDNNIESLHSALKYLSKKYELLILYPNQDIYIKYLSDLYLKIKDYSFIAFNQSTIKESLNKIVQYDYCEKLNIPYPNTLLVNKLDDINKIYELDFPVIIKPSERDNISGNVFRNLLLNSKNEYDLLSELSKHINNGISFLASEVIPGDGSNIYSYMSFRSKDGKILGEWTGKKLSQFPNNFGVFSSASNESSEIVLEQGRMLLKGMNLYGINQPEFKYDPRDQKYKLMEINLRPMMWHRLGALSGVPLNYIQYLRATNKDIPKYVQKKNNKIHYTYLNHELINLLYRSNYYSKFKNNVFNADKIVLALWDLKDPLPFFYSFISVVKKYFRYKRKNKH